MAERVIQQNTENIVWFTCQHCGKRFNNEYEVAEPHRDPGGAVRYYFTGGSVLYPKYGQDWDARCWECLEP